MLFLDVHTGTPEQQTSCCGLRDWNSWHEMIIILRLDGMALMLFMS